VKRVVDNAKQRHAANKQKWTAVLKSQGRSTAVRSRGPAGLTPWMARIEHVLCAAANKFLRGKWLKMKLFLELLP
jgi:hypothetical protein